jgi:2,4-dienoyl-CoA reductase-like NADH-dependent reductase (Old Yellow Enzyme family)
MTSRLFSPLTLGQVTAPNRLVVAPMCQYSAVDGCMTDWHLQHLMTQAMSGAGQIIVEATAVERHGRITHGCVGLYSDDNERALQRVLAAARSVAMPGAVFGIQLGHAGRKGSAQRPWEGGQALTAHQEPWPVVAASALPHDKDWHVPEVATEQDLTRIREAFVSAAKRAVRLGFEVIELHMAHGYLLSQFTSPLANLRQDAWGGDQARRHAFPLSIAKAVRAVVPGNVALGARISGSDWAEGGATIEDAVALTQSLEREGLEWLCVSSGGIAMQTQKITIGPGYQVPFAAAVKRAVGIPVRAVGLITEPQQAEDILASDQADMIALARAFLNDPRWGWHAAEMLGDRDQVKLPVQYERAGPTFWSPARANAKT